MTPAEERMTAALEDMDNLSQILDAYLDGANGSLGYLRRKIRENALEASAAFSAFCDEVNAEINVLKAKAT